MSLHDRIKEARTNKNLTQEQLGKLIGVAKTTIAGYEKNREPAAAKLGEIADALDVDVNFLLQDEMKNPLTEKPQEDNVHSIDSVITEDEQKIYDLLYEVFVRSGIVKEGEKLSYQHTEFIGTMLHLMKVLFKDTSATDKDTVNRIG